MEKISGLLAAAREKGSSSLFLAPFSEPRFRRQQGWEPLVHDKMDPGQVRDVLWSILTDSQRAQLGERSAVMGSVALSGNMNIHFHVFKHKLGYSGIIKEIRFGVSDLISDFLPPIVVETVSKSKGITVVAGPSWSGKTSTVALVVDRINQEKMDHIVLMETSLERIHRPMNSIVSQLEMGFSEVSPREIGTLHQGDIICVDHSSPAQALRMASDFANAGKSVILTAAVESLSSFKKHLESHNQTELFDKVNLFLNQRVLSGLSTAVEVAQEVIILNETIRNYIKDSAYSSIYKEVAASGEKLGMRTLNQALLQLSLRRKIDFKAAFQVSYDPQELDQLFSKMGV